MTTTQRLGFDIVATDKTGVAFNSAKKLLDQMQGVQNKFNALAGPMKQAERNAGTFGNRIQNVSLQLGDFAVQVGSGTDATRALTQQLPQLLGSFGVFGAVAGAAAAILIPLAQAMGKTRDYAQELSSGVEKLDATQKISRSTISDLTEEWGQNARAIMSVAAAQEELAKIGIKNALLDEAKALSELNSGFIGTAGVFGEIANQWKNLDFSRSVIGQMIAPLDDAAKSVNFLKDKFSLTEQAARALTGPFQDFEHAIVNMDTQAASQSLEQFANWIKQNGEAAKTAIPLLDAMRSKFDALTKLNPLQQVTTSLKQNFGVLKLPGETVVNKVGGSDSEAVMASAKAATAAAAEFQRFIDVVNTGVTPLQRMQEVLRQAQENFAQFGGNMDVDQISQYTTYVADLNTKIGELTFKGRWDDMAAGMQTVTEAMSPFRTMVEDMGKGIQSNLVDNLTGAFSSFVDGTESAKQALRSFGATFAKEVTAMIAKALILFAVQKLVGLATGSTGFGLLTQMFGGVYGNGGVFSAGQPLKAFANGGVVGSPTYFPMASGSVGLMGEAGPEAIVPLTRQNGKLGVGASPVNVQINNYSSAAVKTKQGDDGRLQIDIIEKVVAHDLRRGGPISNSLQHGYGLRRAGR